MRANIADRIKRLGLKFKWQQTDPTILAAAKIKYREMNLTMRSQNFSVVLLNRGDSIDVPAHSKYVRTKPCLRVFDEMQIEADGTLMPCCECRSDNPTQKQYAMGRLKPGDSLVAAWSSQTPVIWRKALFSWEPKTGPCAKCVSAQKNHDTTAARTAIANFRSAVNLDETRQLAVG